MKRLDVLDLSEDARDLIRECEARGERTLFERNGRPVAVLVSHDEYMALRETIDIANDSLLFARLAEADESSRRRVDESSSRRAEETPGDSEPLVDSTTRRLDDATRRLERLVLADLARGGLDALTGVLRRRALSALARINSDPISGAPLFDPLKGLWSYRTEELRIVYRIVAEARVVVVLSIDRLRP